MMIEHNPLFDTDKVIDHYSDKDGVPVNYVCTTELIAGSCVPVDVFYRETPHPKFGNRYFGLRYVFDDHFDDRVLITNADLVEEHTLDCVEDSEGNLQYSRHRHDCVALNNGNTIDGGRLYTRTSGCAVFTYTVRDGIVEPLNETATEHDI